MEAGRGMGMRPDATRYMMFRCPNTQKFIRLAFTDPAPTIITTTNCPHCKQHHNFTDKDWVDPDFDNTPSS